MNEILIYKNENQIEVEVTYLKDNLWLSLNQISTLFERDKSVISRHLNSIYKENELNEKATVAKNATVQLEGKREVTREIVYYNLDAIISVGYRVNSKKGTQFRIWATNTLKAHLIDDYTENKKRLEQLKKTIQLVQRTTKNLNEIEANSTDFIDILSDYTKALDILDDYDHQKFTKVNSSDNVVFKINYSKAINAIEQLRLKFGASALFGNQKDQSFKSSIAVIDQTFDSNDLYPSIEEKAANLLYIPQTVIKKLEITH